LALGVDSLKTLRDQMLYSYSQNRFQEPFMSAPSRRPEIRRRRTRKEKIVQLRKRLAAAKTDADRARITAKLHKLAILSPGQPLVK
jgi:uncharacterized protein DUF6800